MVPFGKRKLCTGIVKEIHEKAPSGYTAKYIDDIPESKPSVNSKQLKFWEWMSDYYLCSEGEVLLAALPSAMRLGSETKVVPNPAFDGDITSLDKKEQLLLSLLVDREVMSASEVGDVLGVKNPQRTIKKLIDATAILIMEDIKKGYKPKTESFVRLTEECSGEDGLQAAFRSVSRAPKQEELLLGYLQLMGIAGEEIKEVSKAKLIRRTGTSPSHIKSLEKKGIFEVYKKEVGRLQFNDGTPTNNIELSQVQDRALKEINSAFAQKDQVLLHGITSSGKTEIYISMIKEKLEKGEQVLYILPEIALTTQMINRLKAHFGDMVAVYHSRFNQNERVELWNTILENQRGKARLILGARSALFLPFSNLGLIIVDEEHETSFKQFDPAPRYHARDAALVLAGIHKAKTLLGSATPSFETYFHAKNGKYGYVSINERYGGVEPPEIESVSLKSTDESGYFTPRLLEEMKGALSSGKQIILFQNRRGYAPVLLCNTCGWSPECTRCDVTLTYHKNQDRYLCHYCGSRYTAPPQCPACGSHSLRLAGFGTERIEEEIPIYFPEAKIARLDLDSTRSKHAYANILSDFQNGLIDILIGTQMVTKGLDFENVSMVGILHADLLMRFPDFRSVERAFQLMAQVAGRAGRKNERGKVIIQSRDPDQWLVKKVKEMDYLGVLEKEMIERKEFGYPPYTRLIRLTFRHRQIEMVDYASSEFKKVLLKHFGEGAILGPEYPMVARIKNRFNKNILIKFPRGVNPAPLKSKITNEAGKFFASKEFKQVRLIINVDPY